MVRKFSFSPLGSEISKKVILSSNHETDSSKKSSLLICAFLKRELCCGEQISSPASLYCRKHFLWKSQTEEQKNIRARSDLNNHPIQTFHFIS